MSEENKPVETQEVEENTNSFVDSYDDWDDIDVSDVDMEEDESLEELEEDLDESEESEEKEETKESIEHPELEEEESEEEEKEAPEDEKEDKKVKEEVEETQKEEEITSETIKDKTFKIKVDGKEVEISGQDLINKASGNLAVEKRFAELDKEKKAFYDEKSQVEAYIADFGAKVKDGNILGGLEYFGQFAGLPPYVLKEQLIAALTPVIEERAYLTPEELKNQQLKAENEYLAQKNESDAKRSQEKQAQEQQEAAQRELDQAVNGLKETHSISEQEWDLAFTNLDETLPPDQEIFPDMVKEKVLEIRNQTQLSNRVKTVVSDYEGELNDQFIADLKKVAMENPDLSDDDLKKVIEESLKLHKEKQLKERLKNKSKNKSGQSQKDEDLDEYDLSEYLDEEDGW